MAGLFDIASSGIQAYRSALAVTGQNIANINTEGYRRREASLQEISAGQSDVLTRADQTGLGVRVADIARSFDSFLAARTRDTAASHAAASSRLAGLEEIERAFLPGGPDLASFMNDFFSGLGGIGQSPGDLAPRIAALEQGRTLATAFADTAANLTALQGAIEGQARQTVSEFNLLLKNMAQTQARVLASGQSGAASNAVLDERDRLIAELGGLAGVDVAYQPRQDVVLRLGAGGGGPVVLTGKDAQPIALRTTDGRLAVMTGTGRSATETLQVTTGSLAGLIDAYDALSTTIGMLDDLAQTLAGRMNTVHAGGLTLDGTGGGPLFTTDRCTLVPAATNLGQTTASLRAPDILPADPGPLDLVYDGRAGLWRGFDPDGREVIAGAGTLRHGAVEISLQGQPADGDVISLRVTVGKAANMRFLPDRPQAFAAAGLALASADAANPGSGTVAVGPSGPLPPTPLPAIGALVPNDGSALSAVQLRQDGALAVIPAGTRAVDLISLARQASVGFTLTSAQVQTAEKSLELTLDGDVQVLIALPDPAPEGLTLADIARRLNDGTIKTNDDQTLAQLGLHVSGDGGQLTISAASGGITGRILGAGDTVLASGIAVGANTTPSDIQIFTREGRHVAGSPMTGTAIAALLTAENGFLPDAEYRADTLNGASGAGYLGMQVSRISPVGTQVLRLDASDLAGQSDAALTLWPDTARAEAFALGPIAEGASAADVAAAINAQSGDTGVRAAARTLIELAPAGDTAGTITLTLAAAGRDPVIVSAPTPGTDMGALRDALNARAADTGLRATLTPDRTRIVLEQAEGADVVISAAGTGPGLRLRPLNDLYLPTDEAVDLGADVQTIQGIVRVGGAAAFQLAGQTSAADPLTAGMLQREQSGAGRVQTVTIGLDEAIDTSQSALDGSAAITAAARHEMTVRGLTASVESGVLAPATAAAVGAALIAGLRAQAPIPSLSLPLAALPTEGATLGLRLDGLAYSLTIRDGVPVIEGGEAGRISASLTAADGGGFDLTISAAGGAVSGQSLQLTEGDPAGFGLTDFGAASGSLLGRAVDRPADAVSLGIVLNGEEYALTLSISVEGVVTSDPALPDGLALSFTTDGRLVFSLEDPQTATLRIIPSDGAETLGLKVAAVALTPTDSGLRATSLDGEAVELSAQAQSLAGERLTLTDLPDEDLIVVMGGSAVGAPAARLLALRMDTAPPAPAPFLPAEVELRVIDASTRRVEIVDTASGHSIATRILPADGVVTAAGLRFDISGAIETGDRFRITPNTGATGDARTIDALLALEIGSAADGTPGFQDIYRALLTDVGARVRSADMAATSALALRDAAAEVESALAGVNLDTEAARLLEQQQAYQALSRALAASNDLLDTLLQSI